MVPTPRSQCGTPIALRGPEGPFARFNATMGRRAFLTAFSPRFGRKLAQPDIFRQGHDRRSVAVRVRVGSVIDRGAPGDSPFPIFLARARDQTVIRVQRQKKSRPCVRPPLVLEHDFDRAFVSVRWIPARPKTKNKG